MRSILVAAFFVTSLEALAADSYLCIAEHTAGFSFDGARGEWSATTFKTDAQFLISRAERKGMVWEVKEIGSKNPVYVCGADFNEIGNLFCNGIGELRMNRKNLRFLTVYPVGYWTDKIKGQEDFFVEGRNTPAMSIGKCSPL